MSELLPPAILELVVDTAQWIAGLEEALAALEEFNAALAETASLVASFGEDVSAAMVDAGAATEEAAGVITAAADEVSVAYDRMAESADAAAASMDVAAASSEEAGGAAAASGTEMGGAEAAISGSAEKAGLAIAAIGGVSITMAADFQASVTRLVTSAGESASATGLISQGLLDMSTQVGFTANEMAKAMYPIESAGYHAADGLTVMKAAAEGAKDEGADLAHVADAVTTVMQDYNLKASQAGDVTSEMVKAISFGKTNFDAFSKSLATVLPIASSVHLSFADVASVEASMTAHGTTAQKAAMDVAAAIKSLISPTTQMTKEFTALGVSTDEISGHLSKDGLSGTLEWLRQVAEKSAASIGQTVPEAMKKLIGTSPGLQAALEVTSGDADTLSDAIKAVGAATTDANGDVLGFSEVQGNMSFMFDQFKAELEKVAISIGNVMMPAVISLMKMLDSMFQSMSKNNVVGDAFKEVINVIGNAFAALRPIMGPLANTFHDLVIVIGASFVNSLKVLAPAVANLLDLIDAIFQSVEPLIPTLSQIADVAGKMLGDSIKGLVTAIKPILPLLEQMTKVSLANMLNMLTIVAPGVVQLVKALASIIPAMAPAIPFITDLMKNMVPMFTIMAKGAAESLAAIAWVVEQLVGGFAAYMQLSGMVGKWLNDLPRQFQGMSEDIGRWLNALPGKIGHAFDDLNRYLTDKWNAAMNGLKQQAKNSVTATVAQFTDLPQKLGYVFGEILGVVYKKSSEIGKSIVDGVRKGAEAIVVFLSVDLKKDLLNAMVDANKWMTDKGAAIGKGLLNGIITFATAIEKWFLDLPGVIKGWISDAGNWLIKTGHDLMQGLIDGIIKKLQDIANAISGGGGSVKNTITHPFDSAVDWLNSAGSDLLRGLWSGIVAQERHLVADIGNVADSIKKGFQDALGINSPSKMMADFVGTGIMEGIALGMTNNLHLVHNAIDTVKGALRTGFNAAGGMSFGLPVGIGGMPASAGGGIFITNNVQGNVVAEQQLQQLNQTQTLRYNFRNPTNGLSLFGRGTS